MKRSNKKLIITALALLLVWSITLNLLQGQQIDKLMLEMNSMKYSQSVISHQIDELEHQEELDYVQE